MPWLMAADLKEVLKPGNRRLQPLLQGHPGLPAQLTGGKLDQRWPLKRIIRRRQRFASQLQLWVNPKVHQLSQLADREFARVAN